MNLLRQKVIEALRQAREELLAIKKDSLTSNFLIDWYKAHNSLWLKTARYNVSSWLRFMAILRGYEEEDDIDVLENLRGDLVEVLDEAITHIDGLSVIRSVLEERIVRVKDTKLSALLNEFAATKDTAPNVAAIGFRTILSLIIQERAKIANPASSLATRTDLALDQMMRDALREHIFSDAEQRLLNRFANGGQKDTFDNITHKPGALYLIDKSNLEDAVDLLNMLLAHIID